jgi:hypothetical protein
LRPPWGHGDISNELQGDIFKESRHPFKTLLPALQINLFAPKFLFLWCTSSDPPSAEKNLWDAGTARVKRRTDMLFDLSGKVALIAGAGGYTAQ